MIVANRTKSVTLTFRFSILRYLGTFNAFMCRSVHALSKQETDHFQVGFTIGSPPPKWPYTGGSSVLPILSEQYYVFNGLLVLISKRSENTRRSFHFMSLHL
jgi:hypothetical protein